MFIATYSFPVTTNQILIFKWFSACQLTRLTGSIFIWLLDHAEKAPLINIKIECQRWPDKPLISGRSGTQYVTMVANLSSVYCEAHLVESHCKDSNILGANWLRHPSSYLVEFMTSSLHQFAYFKSTDIRVSGTKRDISNQHFSSWTDHSLMR